MEIPDHALQCRVDRLESQVSELASLFHAQMLAPPTIIGVLQRRHGGDIVSFDRDDRIHVPTALVKTAFTENPRLVEYCRMEDGERVDAEKAAPYVLEALIDLVRRAHQNPVYRNVYLSPLRADQVMVCLAGTGAEILPRWEARPLVEAVRLLFDGVAGDLHRIVVTDLERAQLPLGVQGAAAWMPNLYEDEPERFVKDGRAPMAAHLANTRPL
jgi:hypothetical protein